MILHTFIDKCNTIIMGSKANTGLNPVAELNYGENVSRILLSFNIDEIKALHKDGVIANPDAAKYTLKMTNCFSVDSLPYEKNLSSGFSCSKHRAASFDVLLFTLPKSFDAGRGFDSLRDAWIPENRSFSQNGCNWFNSRTASKWQEEGVYSRDTLVKAYEDFSKGEESIVIARQHFDFGNENLSIDITDYINHILVDEKPFYGLGLCFSPDTESIEDGGTHYVGFFTDHTNTFFHPFVEIDYQEYITDNRDNFRLGKENRLYLYVTDDGEPVNLDTLPVCAINGQEYDVKQAGKGVYYASIFASKSEMEENTILYDNWSNLALNGEKIDDVEMEFVVLPSQVKPGSSLVSEQNLVPSIAGVNSDETLLIGEKRTVEVDFRQKFTTDKRELLDNAEYRLYVKDGNREIDIIKYHPIEHTYMYNFFVLDTSFLIPNEYFVDVRVKKGFNTNYFKKVLTFKVASNITKRYY